MIIFILFAFVASVFLIAFFLPSFFFADYKYKSINNQAQSTDLSDANKYENSASFVKKVNAMAKILSYGNASSTLNTDIIDKIISLKNSDIEISSISILSGDNANIENVTISGISGDRDDLISFYNDLKGDGSFQNVILPISSLIEDEGAPFTITLSYPIN